MYLCLHVSMSVCIYVCMCLCLYVSMSIYAGVCLSPSMSEYVLVRCTYIRVVGCAMPVPVCVCLPVSVYVRCPPYAGAAQQAASVPPAGLQSCGSVSRSVMEARRNDPSPVSATADAGSRHSDAIISESRVCFRSRHRPNATPTA